MGSLYNPRGVMSIRIEDLLDREKFKEEMIQLRRVFHQFPELSQHESGKLPKGYASFLIT